MWCVNPMLPHALEVIDAWGFKFKTVAFTWAKRSTTGRAWHTGLGYWTRQNTEQCLLATRGKPKRIARNVPQLVVAPRSEEHTSELQSLMRISYAVFCLKKKNNKYHLNKSSISTH